MLNSVRICSDQRRRENFHEDDETEIGHHGDGEDIIDDLVPDPLDDEDFEVGELEPGLFDNVTRPTDINDLELQMEAGEEDGDSPMTNLEHDDTHDWHEDRNTLELNNQKIREAAKWLKEQKETFELASENTVLNPNTLNEDQRLVHDVAMDAMEGEQKLRECLRRRIVLSGFQKEFEI